MTKGAKVEREGKTIGRAVPAYGTVCPPGAKCQLH